MNAHHPKTEVQCSQIKGSSFSDIQENTTEFNQYLIMSIIIDKKLIVPYKYCPPVQTINKEYYPIVLGHLRK